MSLVCDVFSGFLISCWSIWQSDIGRSAFLWFFRRRLWFFSSVLFIASCLCLPILCLCCHCGGLFRSPYPAFEHRVFSGSFSSSSVFGCLRFSLFAASLVSFSWILRVRATSFVVRRRCSFVRLPLSSGVLLALRMTQNP